MYLNFLKKGSVLVLQQTRNKSLSESINTYFQAKTATECQDLGRFLLVHISLKQRLISFNLILLCQFCFTPLMCPLTECRISQGSRSTNTQTQGMLRFNIFLCPLFLRCRRTKLQALLTQISQLVDRVMSSSIRGSMLPLILVGLGSIQGSSMQRCQFCQLVQVLDFFFNCIQLYLFKQMGVHIRMHIFIDIVQYYYTTYQMQAQSKTDQLIYRISYRNHKKRLTEIKQHNTSLQFYNKNKGKPNDKKKILMLKMKRQQIQMENQILQQKINKIKGKRESRDQTDSPQHHKHRYRYNDEKQPNDKIQVKSDYGDGQTKICVVPYADKKHKKTPYTSSHKRSSHHNPLGKGSKIQQNQSSQHKSNSHPHLSQPKYKGSLYTKLGSIRQSIAKPQQETLYHEPQKQSNRLVMFKKTRIPQPMLSYLIQISLIKKSILVTAYAMGIYNHTLKLVLDPKKSQQLLRQVDDDYEKIWERVAIDSQNQTIKIMDYIASQEIKFPTDSIEKKKQPKQTTKHHIQEEFIKRNYYTIKQQNQQKQQTINKSIEKPQFKPNPRKVTPIFRHTKIGEDWKKQYKPDEYQEYEEKKEEVQKNQQIKVQGIKFKQKKPNESIKMKNQPKIQKKPQKKQEKKPQKKIQKKQEKKPQKKIEKKQEKKPQKKIQKSQNKVKTIEGNKSESLVESKNQSKIENISRNTNQEEQKQLKESNAGRQSQIEESKQKQDEYIDQFQQSKDQKLQKSKEIEEQQYEEQFQEDNQKGQQSYEMEFQDNAIKNESKVKESNVYEEDFDDEPKKKEEVEEYYDDESDI